MLRSQTDRTRVNTTLILFISANKSCKTHIALIRIMQKAWAAIINNGSGSISFVCSRQKSAIKITRHNSNSKRSEQRTRDNIINKSLGVLDLSVARSAWSPPYQSSFHITQLSVAQSLSLHIKIAAYLSNSVVFFVALFCFILLQIKQPNSALCAGLCVLCVIKVITTIRKDTGPLFLVSVGAQYLLLIL